MYFIDRIANQAELLTADALLRLATGLCAVAALGIGGTVPFARIVSGAEVIVFGEIESMVSILM